MIYLGDQNQALDKYSEKATCWLGIKIKGRLTTKNVNGFCCGVSQCEYCFSNTKRRSGLLPSFTNLFTSDIIKELIITKPSRLFEIYTDLSEQYLALGNSILNFNEQCKLLFVDSGYTDWFLKEKWNYKVAKLIDHHTCTYCNREYIFVYKKDKGKGMVPQFDHWFAKNDYPLLALSFYNLIPSCSTCNTIKSDNLFNLSDNLHPYLDINISSSYTFSYLVTSESSNEIIFKNNSIFNTKGIDTITALNLPLIYKGHSSKELQDLIDLKYKYSKNYLDVLLNQTFENLNISYQERYRLIFGIEIDEDKLHKRIFSKFKNDIIKELIRMDN